MYFRRVIYNKQIKSRIFAQSRCASVLWRCLRFELGEVVKEVGWWFVGGDSP